MFASCHVPFGQSVKDVGKVPTSTHLCVVLLQRFVALDLHVVLEPAVALGAFPGAVFKAGAIGLANLSKAVDVAWDHSHPDQNFRWTALI